MTFKEKNYFENEIIELKEISNTEFSEFINCDFNSLNFSEMSFKNSKFIECRFKKCNLTNSSFTGTAFREVSFEGCKLLGINWSDTTSSSLLSFSDSILDLCVFQSLDMRGLKAINCSIKDAHFSQSKLQNSYFFNTNLEGTTFSQCDFSNSDFRGSKGYFIDPSFNCIKDARFSMPEAMVFFEALKINVEY